MVMLELMRCCNSDWERTNQDIEENILTEELNGGGGGTVSGETGGKRSGGGGRRGGGGGLGVVRRYYQSGAYSILNPGKRELNLVCLL